MKAIQEIGLRRAIRFAWVSVLLGLLKFAFLPPLRAAFLRMCGARIGHDTVLQSLVLINVDRGGFRALTIGDHCFIGDQVLFDLAAPIVLEEHVTLATRAMVLTHLNVGYKDHPLQAAFPSTTKGVTIKRGSFIGAGSTILAGCALGPEAFVAAGAVVNRDVAANETVGGVPIRTLGSSRA